MNKPFGYPKLTAKALPLLAFTRRHCVAQDGAGDRIAALDKAELERVSLALLVPNPGMLQRRSLVGHLQYPEPDGKFRNRLRCSEVWLAWPEQISVG